MLSPTSGKRANDDDDQTDGQGANSKRPRRAIDDHAAADQAVEAEGTDGRDSSTTPIASSAQQRVWASKTGAEGGHATASAVGSAATAALRPWHTCAYLSSTSALLQGEAASHSARAAPPAAPPSTAHGFKGFTSSASSTSAGAGLAPLLALLSEDVLVLICEHLTVADLAAFDAVCTHTHAMLTQPPLTAGVGADADAATPHRYSPIHDDSEASASATAAAVAAAVASPAHYLWRAAALSPSSWPFPPSIDREHLERTVLTHLRTLPPRSYPPSQAAGSLGSSMSALQLLLMPPTTQSLQTLDRVMPNFPLPRHALEHTAAQQAQQQAQQQQQQQQRAATQAAEQTSANAVATVAILTPEIGAQRPAPPSSSQPAATSAPSPPAASPPLRAEEESFAHAQQSHAMAIAMATTQAHEQAMLAQAQAAQAHAHALALAQARAHAEAQEAAAQADALAAAQQQQQPLHHHHQYQQPQALFGMAEIDFGSSAAGGSGVPHATLLQQLHAHAQGHAAQQGYRAARHSLRAAPPALDWKSILSSVGSRRAARGTGTLVLDMGSCTVTVGMGGLDCGPTDGLGNSASGSTAATPAASAPGLGVTTTADASSSGSTGAVPTGPLPKSFPAIALNELVGDQIGSQSVRSINPVSSISMPILHANETGEFGYCSPIWKYAVQQVPRDKFMGGAARARARGVRRGVQGQEGVAAAASSSSLAATSAPSAAAAAAVSSPRPALSASASASVIPATSLSPPPVTKLNSGDVGVDSGDCIGVDDNGGGFEGEGGEEEAGSILICDQLLGSRLELAKKRAKVARILFSLWPRSRTRKLKLAFCNESFLSLLHTGKTTGVVLHVGFSRSTCAIFVNGRIQNLHSLPTRMVGGHIHSRIMLQALFSRRQFQPAVADMFAVIPLLKECCYVAADTPEELQKPREETHVDIEITGQRLTLGQERFTSSDVFFLYGFPAMVVEALQSSPAWPVLQKPVQMQQPVPTAGQHRSMAMAMAAYGPGPATAAQMGYAPPALAHSHSQDAQLRTMQAHQAQLEASARKEMATQQRGQTQQQQSSAPIPEPVRASSPARSRSRPLSPMLTAQSTAGSVAAMIAAGTALQGERAPDSSASSSSAATAALVDTAMSMQSAPPSSSSAPPASCHDDGAVVVGMVDTRSPSSSVSSSSSAQTHASVVSTCSSEDEPHHLIKTLLQNIVLSGRSTSLKGFAQRFERDLNAILKQDTPAKVHENPVECSWLGGSVLCSLSIYLQLCFDRDEFEQDGINAVLRHMEI